jgi:hypothetical protein
MEEIIMIDYIKGIMVGGIISNLARS